MPIARNSARPPVTQSAKDSSTGRIVAAGSFDSRFAHTPLRADASGLTTIHREASTGNGVPARTVSNELSVAHSNDIPTTTKASDHAMFAKARLDSSFATRVPIGSDSRRKQLRRDFSGRLSIVPLRWKT